MTEPHSPDAWEAFITEIEPHVSPEWMRNARAHGSHGWIRLIALVDVHHQLTSPQIVEKVAMTMADLAGRKGQLVADIARLRQQAKSSFETREGVKTPVEVSRGGPHRHPRCCTCLTQMF